MSVPYRRVKTFGIIKKIMEQTLDWTGERLVTTIKSIGAKEHLHRYAIALDFVENKHVLDIATGEGYGANLISQKAKYVIGVDISEEAIAHARKKYKKDNLDFKVGSVTNIPVTQSSIDIVVSFETIEHIIDQEEMLNEIKRVLKSDGILIISSPEKANYEDINETKNQFHVKELYFNDFENLIKNRFQFYSFLFQKQIYGTIIVPKSNIFTYKEYMGSFDKIETFKILNKPIFNICIASNMEIPNLSVSYFDASECLTAIRNDFNLKMDRILNSKTFKLSRFLSLPYRLIHRILK